MVVNYLVPLYLLLNPERESLAGLASSCSTYDRLLASWACSRMYFQGFCLWKRHDIWLWYHFGVPIFAQIFMNNFLIIIQTCGIIMATTRSLITKLIKPFNILTKILNGLINFVIKLRVVAIIIPQVWIMIKKLFKKIRANYIGWYIYALSPCWMRGLKVIVWRMEGLGRMGAVIQWPQGVKSLIWQW